MTKFLRLGDIVVNEDAIVSVFDEGDKVVVTLLSTLPMVAGSLADGHNSVGVSENIEYCGAQAKALRNYFFSAATSKKIC